MTDATEDAQTLVDEDMGLFWAGGSILLMVTDDTAPTILSWEAMAFIAVGAALIVLLIGMLVGLIRKSAPGRFAFPSELGTTARIGWRFIEYFIAGFALFFSYNMLFGG